MLGGDHSFVTVYQPLDAASPEIGTDKRMRTIRERCEVGVDFCKSSPWNRNAVLYHDRTFQQESAHLADS